MSKKALYLLGIALTIILGTILYIKFCCNCDAAQPKASENAPSALVKNDNFVPFIDPLILHFNTNNQTLI